MTDYVAGDASSSVAVTADVSDVAALRTMLASPSPEVLAAMQAHGVVQPISFYVEADPRTSAPWFVAAGPAVAAASSTETRWRRAGSARSTRTNSGLARRGHCSAGTARTEEVARSQPTERTRAVPDPVLVEVESVEVVREIEGEVQLLAALERRLHRLDHLPVLGAGDLARGAKPERCPEADRRPPITWLQPEPRAVVRTQPSRG